MGYSIAIDGPAGAGKKYNRQKGGGKERLLLCGHGRNLPRDGIFFAGKRRKRGRNRPDRKKMSGGEHPGRIRGGRTAGIFKRRKCKQ